MIVCVPLVKERRNVPSVEGAITRWESRLLADRGGYHPKYDCVPPRATVAGLRASWARHLCADLASRSSRRPRWDVMSVALDGGSRRRADGADLRLARMFGRRDGVGAA
jgi:hypothetical protein